MGMFLIEKGSPVEGIKYGLDWREGRNWVRKNTNKTLVFPKGMLLFDPTGISTWCVDPDNPIDFENGDDRPYYFKRSALARCGFYGFLLEVDDEETGAFDPARSWYIVVNRRHVQYG